MINFYPTLDVINHRVLPLIDELNGLYVIDTEQGKEKAEIRSHKAEVSRKLLELADICALLEALVRNEYHYMKGHGFDIEIGVLEND